MSIFDRIFGHGGGESSEDWVRRGESYRRSLNLSDALKCFDKAINLDKDNFQAWNYKAVVLQGFSPSRTQDVVSCYNSVLAVCDNLLRLDRSNCEALNYKGLALFGLNHVKEALECFNRALSINSQYPEAWYHKGNALSALGELDEALECYDMALGIDTTHAMTQWFGKGATVWYNKGNILCINYGEYQKGLACYDEAVSLDADYPEAWQNRGVALLELGKYQEAVTSFDRAIAIKPPYPRSWYDNVKRNRADALNCLKNR